MNSIRSGSGQQLRQAGNQVLGRQEPKVEKGAAVITIDELQRIRMQCSTGNNYEAEMRNRERQTLQEKSKGRIQNWTNTAEATRARRDAERI